MPLKPLVELDQVSFRYDARPVLEDVSIVIQPGKSAALIGPSGAGKTSLLRLVLGLLTPTKGSVRVAGGSAGSRSSASIGYVPQLDTVDWNFPITVTETVLLGRIRRAGMWPWASAEDRRCVESVLDRLGIADLAGRHIRSLSGGQQQRVFLARALAAEPDLLVLDEPTSGVDPRSAENVLHMVSELNRQGMTVLMSTHDLNMAAAHVPRLLCLNRRIIADGSPEDVLTPAILSDTYEADMAVFRQDGMLFVHQKPHRHTYAGDQAQRLPAELLERVS